MNEIIMRFSADEYMAALPRYSREAIADVIKNNGDLLAAARELASIPAAGLATKGGVKWPSDFFDRFMNEMKIFICGDAQKYQAIRDKIKEEGNLSSLVLVAIISGAVGDWLGFGAALCTPFVALVLAAVSKIGVEAWCIGFSASRQVNSPPADAMKAPEAPPQKAE